MIGDVNLFFHEYLEAHECEIDVMIAEKGARGKGLGAEAVRTAMQFAKNVYAKQRCIAKIKIDNMPSIKLFENLHFQKFAELKHFDEVHYAFDIKSESKHDDNSVPKSMQEEYEIFIRQYGLEEIDVEMM
jgi:RimJ/RimL family protein N-acetyltransferase